jgi:ribonuclease E
MAPEAMPAEQQPLEGMTEAQAQPETRRDEGRREDGEERRERRSRDRYGRDRRERGPREEVAAAPIESAMIVPDAEVIEATQPVMKHEAAAPQAPQSAQQAAPRRMPKVTPFELPIEQLNQVAEGSGLQWVNSDAGKIAAVRAAIAAEPKPVHVPRERPPIIVIDEGPLVLVETRRDLRDLKLPFEQQALPLQ